jgi:hypothetical protein
MIRNHFACRRNAWSRIAGASICVLFIAAGHLFSNERVVVGFTEATGGTPAPVQPPPPAVKHFNPKETSVFTDEASFLSSVSCRTVSLESFEGLAATNTSNRTVITTPDFTVTTDNPPRLGVWDQRFRGSYATHGTQWMGVDEGLLVVPQVTTLTFDVMVNHFGINFTDYGTFGNGNLEFANDIGDVATAALSGQGGGNHQFFGIINSSRAFRSVTLTHSISGEFYGIDEIYYCWQVRPDTPLRRQPSGRVIPD